MNKFAKWLIPLFIMPTIAFGARGYMNQKQLQFVDEFGYPVNMGTSVSIYIYDVGTSTEMSCFLDVFGNTAVTQPVTDDSTNTCLDYTVGKLAFFSRGGAYKIYVTDGTYNRTVDNISGSDTRIMFPSFLTAMSGSSYGQNDDIDFTYASWIIDGDTATRLDMIPDADGGILGIGSTSAQADLYWYAGTADYIFADEGNALVNFVDVDIEMDDDATLYFGSDSDVSIKFDNSGDDLDILADDSEISIGVDGGGADVYWHTETASTNVLFDEDANEILATAVDVQLTDAAALILGTGDDFTLQSSTAANLDVLSAVTDESGIVNLGADQKGIDLKLFAATTGDYLLWDASDEQLEAVGADVLMDDDSDIYVGSDKDWKIECDTTTVLELIPLTTDETSSVNIGADQAGADLKVFGTTTGDYIQWDASTDYLHMVGDLVLYTLAEAAVNQFKVDATGTAAGNAIVLETTNGGIQLLADGSDNGDIAIDCEDDMTLTAAGNLTLAVTGTVSAGGSSITNLARTIETFTATDTLLATESGKICVILGAGTPANIILNLPTAAPELEFTFIDANATAADDVYIRAASGDTIEDGSANQYYACKTDAVGQSVTLVAIDATRWKLISSVGTWAADDSPD